MTARELAELLDKVASIELLPGVTFRVTIKDGRAAYGRLDVLVTPASSLRSLVEQLTVLGVTEDGGVIVGPQGWERLQQALTTPEAGEGEAWVSADRVKVRGK